MTDISLNTLSKGLLDHSHFIRRTSLFGVFKYALLSSGGHDSADFMCIIARHFGDPCPHIRGFALEFYLVLAELFLDFETLDESDLRDCLENPASLESRGGRV